MEIDVLPEGRVIWAAGAVRCALGRAGIRTEKREGDGATPAGRFALRRILYRPDRVGRPRTALPVAMIEHADGWCNDPRSPAYNRPVRLPFSFGHEEMWREDGLYDIVAVLGHNDDPVIPGHGSAVFLHVARPDYAPTAGCVALALDDLQRLLRDCGPGAVMRIQAPR